LILWTFLGPSGTHISVEGWPPHSTKENRYEETDCLRRDSVLDRVLCLGPGCFTDAHNAQGRRATTRVECPASGSREESRAQSSAAAAEAELRRDDRP